MSEVSITHKEDTENLLYLARKLQLDEDSFNEDHAYMRESVNSETSMVTTTENISDSETDLLNTIKLGPEVFQDTRILAKTKPFELEWAFGINYKVDIVNLTKEGVHKVLYACSNYPIVYDYCEKNMTHLDCHHQTIVDVSADLTGRWLVTAGNNKEGLINIWDEEQELLDNEKRSPAFTLYSIYGEYGVNLAKISPSAKYLVTVGAVREDMYSVNMWLWTLGNDEPDDSWQISNVYGYPVQICYNPNIEEHIMIIFSKQVLLAVWDLETNNFTSKLTPTILHKNKIGHLTGGTYADNCHECYTSSSKGCVSIFGNTLYAKPFEEGDLDNTKIFIDSIKVSRVSLDCCTTSDGLVVTGDARGEIYFFNKRIEILYWLRDFGLGGITSISFNLTPKLKMQDLNRYYLAPSKEDGGVFNCDFRDMVEELEVLFQQDLPSDVTTKREPFIVRDFFVATSHCNIYAIDVLKNTCTPLFHSADGYVVAIEVHEESNYLIIGYASNKIILMDYEKNEVISETVLPKYDEEPSAISCIKYSVESFHLFCGKTNGELWVLEPILLKPRQCEPFQITKNKIMKIRFSHIPIQCAYYDDKMTVCLFSYNPLVSKWDFRGKIRPHFDEITDMMFLPIAPSKLCTIARDRHLVQYNNDKVDNEDFNIETSDRIEQTAIPTCFIYWMCTIQDKQFGYILLADNMHKFKFLYQQSKVMKSLVLAPAFGCFKNQLIRKMKIIPHCESRFMVFCTNRHFGIHIVPPDGNPYKYVGQVAHPEKLQDFAISHDGKHLFTYGANDHCVFKWSIKTKAVETMKHIGGKELEPFYCLIEGGFQGWLFHEIKDLFYYMQILQQENIDLPRRVTDSISISEIPDLCRTIGYYPSDFELDNIIIDVKYRNTDETNKVNDDINFIDFVKLYCNYKPVYGYSRMEMQKAFDYMVKNCSDDVFLKHKIRKDQLIELLTTEGEPMTRSSVFKCFKTLMRQDNIEENFDFLPEEIDFPILFENILGIDMERERVLEAESSDYDISVDPKINDQHV